MMESNKKLRELTGAGMMDVKKALSDAGNDEDKAIALLNDKGENAWKIGYIKASDSEQRVVIA